MIAIQSLILFYFNVGRSLQKQNIIIQARIWLNGGALASTRREVPGFDLKDYK